MLLLLSFNFKPHFNSFVIEIRIVYEIAKYNKVYTKSPETNKNARLPNLPTRICLTMYSVVSGKYIYQESYFYLKKKKNPKIYWSVLVAQIRLEYLRVHITTYHVGDLFYLDRYIVSPATVGRVSVAVFKEIPIKWRFPIRIAVVRADDA